MDAWQQHGKIGFVERQHDGRMLSWSEIKLIGIAGTGFFMDLFIINMVVPILIVLYYPGEKNITWGLQGGVLKASANIGNVIGQVLFGFLGDSYGRQFVYGKECIIVIVALIVMICAPDSLGGNVTVWITVCRIVMGIGIGGDYPMSAAIVADRANLKRRGTLLALVFSAQGWGGLVGALLALIVIGCYYHKAYTQNDIHSLTGAWRILLGFGIIPAVFVLYFRLTMAESLKFKEARKLQDNPDLIYELQNAPNPNAVDGGNSGGAGVMATGDHGLVAPAAAGGVIDPDLTKAKADDAHTTASGIDEDEEIMKKTAFGWKPEGQRAHNSEFFTYFSEWRHLKILIGCAMSWFLVDIAFYGINLNQSFILAAINFTPKQPYRKILSTAVGNVIIIAAGYFPGYFATVALVEVMGRKAIQIMGFAMTGIFLLIAGADFHNLRTKTAPFFIVFTLLQFFFNFGANTTTFLFPAEVFPSRIRATAHGVSAAVGKLGAIIASLGFVEVAKHIGTGDVLLIFMAVSFAGIPFTLLIPETKNRDADVVDREELLEKAQRRDANGGGAGTGAPPGQGVVGTEP